MPKMKRKMRRQSRTMEKAEVYEGKKEVVIVISKKDRDLIGGWLEMLLRIMKGKETKKRVVKRTGTKKMGRPPKAAKKEKEPEVK